MAIYFERGTSQRDERVLRSGERGKLKFTLCAVPYIPSFRLYEPVYSGPFICSVCLTRPRDSQTFPSARLPSVLRDVAAVGTEHKLR